MFPLGRRSQQSRNDSMTNPTFTFSAIQKLRLQNVLDEVIYNPDGSCDYVNELKKLAYHSLPDELIDILHQQKSSKTPKPCIYCENTPTDESIYKVPFANEFREKCKSGHRSENLLVMVAAVLGEPYSMLFEGAEIVNNLVPLQESKHDFTGLGSEVELDFHIENAALKHFSNCNFSPMGLMLSGVSYDPTGPMTRVSDGRAALNLLEDSVRLQLSTPSFRIKVPHRWRHESFGISVEKTDWVPILIDEGHGYPEIAAAFYKDMIEAKDQSSQRAIEMLHAAVRSVSFGVAIKPGQLIYIDNRFAFHSRDRFTPSYTVDGRAKRWLQRVFVAPNLWAHRGLTQVNERIYKVA